MNADPTISAHDVLQARLAGWKEKNPDLRLSFGYIGNCGVDSRGAFDDRSWMVFTNVCYEWRDGRPHWMSFGSYTTNELPLMVLATEGPRFEAWLTRCEKVRLEVHQPKL